MTKTKSRKRRERRARRGLISPEQAWKNLQENPVSAIPVRCPYPGFKPMPGSRALKLHEDMTIGSLSTSNGGCLLGANVNDYICIFTANDGTDITFGSWIDPSWSSALSSDIILIRTLSVSHKFKYIGPRGDEATGTVKVVPGLTNGMLTSMVSAAAGGEVAKIAGDQRLIEFPVGANFEYIPSVEVDWQYHSISTIVSDYEGIAVMFEGVKSSTNLYSVSTTWNVEVIYTWAGSYDDPAEDMLPRFRLLETVSAGRGGSSLARAEAEYSAYRSWLSGENLGRVIGTGAALAAGYMRTRANMRDVRNMGNNPYGYVG